MSRPLCSKDRANKHRIKDLSSSIAGQFLSRQNRIPQTLEQNCLHIAPAVLTSQLADDDGEITGIVNSKNRAPE